LAWPFPSFRIGFVEYSGVRIADEVQQCLACPEAVKEIGPPKLLLARVVAVLQIPMVLHPARVLMGLALAENFCTLFRMIASSGPKSGPFIVDIREENCVEAFRFFRIARA
jgi:hypothetical protein